MVLLAAAGYNGWSTDDVKALLQLNLLGEMINVNRLDSRGNAELLAGQAITTPDGSALLRNDPASGPCLQTSTGTLLWSPLHAPSASDMPGRLIMQNDGNLVFYSRNNVPLWATNTGVSSGASSFLVLSGSTSTSNVSLQVYDYSGNIVSATLYPGTGATQARPRSRGHRRSGAPSPRQLKFSGRIAPQDRLHQITRASAPGEAPDEHYLAPTTLPITITHPGPTHVIGVPQYAPTVFGGTSGYNPAADCAGNFMSFKFQPNNNCYAYGCNITTNTFPQPGRASGNLITSIDGPTIAGFAVQDGLILVGKTLADVRAFAEKRRAAGTLAGHFVALMISPAGDANWPGDYHWARCDDGVTFSSWSQKDGNDQVTNFDFAGNPITDPATASWTVNQGPVEPTIQEPNPPDLNQDQAVAYAFYCYMFVPDTGVTIV